MFEELEPAHKTFELIYELSTLMTRGEIETDRDKFATLLLEGWDHDAIGLIQSMMEIISCDHMVIAVGMGTSFEDAMSRTLSAFRVVQQKREENK